MYSFHACEHYLTQTAQAFERPKHTKVAKHTPSKPQSSQGSAIWILALTFPLRQRCSGVSF